MSEQNAAQSGAEDTRLKRGRKRKTEEQITIAESDAPQKTLFDFCEV